MARRKNSVTIVVPVYGDLPSLEVCLESVLKHVNFSENKLLLVNDRGPEHQLIENRLKQLVKGKKNVEYHANRKNLGFLQNCNNAVMNLDRSDNDILLLNSDTEVTAGFIEALQAVLADDQKIGAVSPRSNNATITTIPITAAIAKDNTPQDSYAAFLRLSEKLPEYNVSPVAHGFCMLIRRSCIRQYGLFDEVFGKGYGEEVDFCLRIRKHGWKVAICNRAFVYHLEARSFTPETKRKLIEENEKVVVRRYPSYRREAREYRLWATEQEELVIHGKTYVFAKKMYRLAKNKLVVMYQKLFNR